MKRAVAIVLAIASWACLACSPFEDLFDSTSDRVDDVRAMQEAGRFRASLVPLRRLLDSDSENAEVNYLNGVALARTGEPGLAIWSLQKASQAPEWEMPASLELAKAALANHSFPSAIKAATRVLELEPDHVAALSIRGEAYLGDRTQPEAALLDFERLLDLDPDNFTARVQQASALLLLKRVDEAEQAFEALLASGKDESGKSNPQLCAAQATFALERGEPELAESSFDSCLERFPGEWIVVSEAVPFFDGRGKPDRSDAILRAALEERPGAGAYRSAIADRMRARGEAAEAEALLVAGTRLEGVATARESWASLANFYLAQSDFQAAATAYERALELGPEPDQQELLDFADLLSLAGQHDRALEIAEDFEQPIFRDLIHARVLLEQKKPKEALERLDAALLLWPNNPAARYYAALASEQVGRFDRAIEEYRQSIRSGGADHTDAPIRLARLLSAEGSLRAALVAVGHRLQKHPHDREAILLSIEVSEKLRDGPQTKKFLALARQTPSLWPKALALSAESLASRQGADAAVDALLANSLIDFDRPENAATLHVLVRQMHAAGRLEEAGPIVAAALSKNPGSSALHAIEGLLLELKGAPPSERRRAYRAALALDPEESIALVGLAKLESLDGNLDAALDFYDRASMADPWDRAPALEAARLLVGADRKREAERRFEALLREAPYDVDAALGLAELRLERDPGDESTLELAKRAMRFGSQEEARALIARVESARNRASPPGS